MTRKEEIELMRYRYKFNVAYEALSNAMDYVVELSDGSLTTISELLDLALVQANKPDKKKINKKKK